jgi:hypothetical protein
LLRCSSDERLRVEEEVQLVQDGFEEVGLLDSVNQVVVLAVLLYVIGRLM